jgi:hypothetical protein
MGHIGVKGLQSAVDGLHFDDSSLPSCEVCARANIRRSPFPNHASHRASHLLERIHCDICGPLPNSYGNFSYYILFVDCYSRFISLFLMKTRNEALSLFIQFKTTAETFSGSKIKLLRVDNAPELVLGQMETFCKAQGITYEKTVPDSPPQNGVAERSNLTICSMARAMLLDANLRDFFWPFAVSAATHIKQRVPHSALPSGLTPFHLWFNRRPDISHLRPFGVTCTARVLATHLSKFEPRGETGRFLGYATDAKGYLIWVPNPTGSGGSVKVRRDVIFHDFPHPSPPPIVPPHYQPLWHDVPFPNRLHQPTTGAMPDPLSTSTTSSYVLLIRFISIVRDLISIVQPRTASQRWPNSSSKLFRATHVHILVRVHHSLYLDRPRSHLYRSVMLCLAVLIKLIIQALRSNTRPLLRTCAS